MKLKTIFRLILVLTVVVTTACTQTNDSFGQSYSGVPSHEKWSELLNKHVRENGLVDYQGFLEDRNALETYTDLLSENAPSNSWSDEDQIAYWINAYNAFTVKLIVDNYPLESIKDLNPTIAIPTIRSIWTKEWFQIGGEDFSLDRIEHKILRKDFEEPRIHFAVNCASISCPPLRNEAYTGEKLNDQLEEQTIQFLNNPERNIIASQSVRVSKIFSWFGGDFKKQGSLIDFLNKYTKTRIDKKASVRYMDYDWGLNDIKKN